jgi:hypothetical protein
MAIESYALGWGYLADLSQPEHNSQSVTWVTLLSAKYSQYYVQ